LITRFIFKDVSSKTDVKLFSIGTHIVPILKSCKNVIYILWDFDWLDKRSKMTVYIFPFIQFIKVI